MISGQHLFNSTHDQSFRKIWRRHLAGVHMDASMLDNFNQKSSSLSSISTKLTSHLNFRYTDKIWLNVETFLLWPHRFTWMKPCITYYGCKTMIGPFITVNEPNCWLPPLKCFNHLRSVHFTPLIHKIVCPPVFPLLVFVCIFHFLHICITVTKGSLCVSARAI